MINVTSMKARTRLIVDPILAASLRRTSSRSRSSNPYRRPRYDNFLPPRKGSVYKSKESLVPPTGPGRGHYNDTYVVNCTNSTTPDPGEH